MRKTGSSLQWVEVDITSVPSVEYPGHLFTFFLGVLQGWWDRLGVLDINTGREFIGGISYDKIWTHTKRHAPFLRSFIVHGTEYTSFPQDLLLQHAPLISNFSSTSFSNPS